MPRLPIVSPNPLIWSREGPIARNPPQHLVRFLSRASLYKFFYFRILPSMFLKTMYFTVEPCLQRVQNRKLAPNTPWGGGEGVLEGKGRIGSQCRHVMPGLLIRQLRTNHWVPHSAFFAEWVRQVFVARVEEAATSQNPNWVQ